MSTTPRDMDPQRTLLRMSRRHALAAGGALALGAATTLPRLVRAQSATPVASVADATPIAGAAATPGATPVAGWVFEDVMGATITLPERPQRIAAAINVAAALRGFGIEVPTIFGWTANHFPDGNHIAWGDIDPAAVEVVSDDDGNVIIDKLREADPDLIVTWVWDRNDPEDTKAGIPADMTAQAEEIAPILILNRSDSNDEELMRTEDLAIALGVNMLSPELVAGRDAYQAKQAELRALAKEKDDLAVLFASFGGGDGVWVAGSDFVADVGQTRLLGVTVANYGAPGAEAYWEELPLDEAQRYPADVIYIDQSGVWTTLEQLRAEPTLSQLPAIKAGQVGLWQRDHPLTYEGLTAFLESVLEPLRDAKKVT
ncbi:MAG: ABC transporter substrate-binding protein [Thermomicrobiales bacterium]